MKRSLGIILSSSIVLFFTLFFFQSCFAVDPNVSFVGIDNVSLVAGEEFAPPLSLAEKIIWGVIISLIFVLIVALFVLAYLLSNFNHWKVISRKLSGAEDAISMKSVERAKKLYSR